jgi:oligopeptide transport system ATP-binding protein
LTPTLAVEKLCVQFAHTGGSITAVHDASLAVQPAECVGIVGESGSGKTQLFMAVMGLLPAAARISGSVRFEGREILGLPPAELNRIRGSRLGMVFQDPMTSLTPHLRIGTQLAEVLVSHSHLSWRDAERAALRILEQVRIPDAQRRLQQYPHELSGGMRQRVMLGMSLLCAPSLLIADEPTTALDVTVQAHILGLLRAVRAESRTAVVLISHDLGVVGDLADRIIVMYGGRVMESGSASRVLRRAQHPYTAELLKCVPDLAGPRLARMPCLPGQPPGPAELARGQGCAFAPRCGRARARCSLDRPLLEEITAAHQVACHFPLSA